MSININAVCIINECIYMCICVDEWVGITLTWHLLNFHSCIDFYPDTFCVEKIAADLVSHCLFECVSHFFKISLFRCMIVITSSSLSTFYFFTFRIFLFDSAPRSKITGNFPLFLLPTCPLLHVFLYSCDASDEWRWLSNCSVQSFSTSTFKSE